MAQNQFSSNPRRRISASARNNEKGQSNREQIFTNSDDTALGVQIIHQALADFVAEKGAADAASFTQQRSGE